MPRQVRIVGEPDVYDVLCETETTMVLVNPAAKKRRELHELEARLATVRRQLCEAEQRPIDGTPGRA